MKHFLLIVAAILVASFSINAAQISENEAMTKAVAFGAKAVSSRLMSNSRTSTMSLAYTAKAAASSDNCFYVFNRGENDGYIIVSAEDRSYPVLGYTDSGSFDPNNMPVNMRWWLGEYQRQIQYLINHPEIKAVGTANPKYIWTTDKVTALLDYIVWNQGAPFNNMCPSGTYNNNGTTVTDHYYTGCAATAMAQIMRFHQWPVKGTGSHSYKFLPSGATDSVALSSTFSDHTYDWANMEPIYNSTSTDVQKSAVAQLMSDCGISLDMMYNIDGSGQSGATTYMPAIALPKYFGYDAGIKLLCRDYYSKAEWDSILHSEIYAKRPILYSGSTSSGAGHAFVCDGYAPGNYYHINWGWGGLSNGYFLSTALDPETQGIGGSMSGYNFNQFITCGIQKATENPVIDYQLAMDYLYCDSTKAVKGATIPVNWYIRNCGLNDVSTSGIAVILYDSNGQIVDKSNDYGSYILLSGGGVGTATDFRIPTTLADGTYKIYFCAKIDGETNWRKCRVHIGYLPYITLTVSGNNVTIVGTNPSALSTSSVVADTKVYSNKTSLITATINNTGCEYKDVVHYELYAVTSDAPALAPTKNASLKSVSSTVSYASSFYLVDIPENSSTSITFKESVSSPAGNYVLRILDKDGKVISSDQNITVLNTPAAAVLSLTTPISFPPFPTNNVPKDQMRLEASITNTGGYYAGAITPVIFPESGGSALAGLDAVNVTIDSAETKVIDFTGIFNEGVEGTKYLIAVFDANYNQIGNGLVFTCGIATSIGKVAAGSCSIYPVPASSVLNVEAGAAISNIAVYSVTGAQVISQAASGSKVSLNVASLSAGSYILKAQTSDGIVVKRFIKK
ncbi:MAG: thiol protease/hemagglutinin PrtT [Muribaculaceae bacterium]|jgi:hypothetical protein|nr:thiol protease/hemagglutinin PrtT [Muribaculaceae bacterium]